MTKKTIRGAGVAASLALLLSACGGPGDEPAPEDEAQPQGEAEQADIADTDVQAEVRGWAACEKFGADFDAVVERFGIEPHNGGPVSADQGIGHPQELVECTDNVVLSSDPERAEATIDGRVSIGVSAAPTAEDATADVDRLLAEAREDVEGDLEEKPVEGAWGEGLLLHGDYGFGETYSVYAATGVLTVRVVLEAGTEQDLDLDGAEEYLTETTVPSVVATVEGALEEAGLDAG
ncbi:hypothetical protein [Salininema proteolyticum]|uniref:Lipoprotein n=1 Tax=Salininema proteolyticum TaxID=1607685 RepID=A0ABV8U262_9ACTN